MKRRRIASLSPSLSPSPLSLSFSLSLTSLRTQVSLHWHGLASGIAPIKVPHPLPCLLSACSFVSSPDTHLPIPAAPPTSSPLAFSLTRELSYTHSHIYKHTHAGHGVNNTTTPRDERTRAQPST